jgi:hypothetical protein
MRFETGGVHELDEHPNVVFIGRARARVLKLELAEP